MARSTSARSNPIDIISITACSYVSPVTRTLSAAVVVVATTGWPPAVVVVGGAAAEADVTAGIAVTCWDADAAGAGAGVVTAGTGVSIGLGLGYTHNVQHNTQYHYNSYEEYIH